MFETSGFVFIPLTVVIVGPFVLDQEKLLLLPFEISEEMEPNAKHLVSFFVFLFLRDEKFFIAGQDQGKLYLVDADDAK